MFDVMNCGEVKDRITSAATAFDTWAELEQAMDDGYVPTLPGRTEAERRLIALLIRENRPCWGNAGKNW